jgi:CDP-diacylglycerol---glycerol-3-phosphate 3-phosphatidyltransferase
MALVSATANKGLSASRRRLLDAARGILLLGDKSEKQQRRILRCFPLKQSHFKFPPLTTPDDFHTALCDKIATAERRVYLASLYIGPAANPVASTKEEELLKALHSTAAPDVKILLDQNRALRPVPVIRHQGKESATSTTTITSAEACYRVLEPKLQPRETSKSSSDNNGIYLLTVLPPWQQRTLQNPYNEVAGVFHLKCYIVDDDVFLTGANLSEEYFCDRTDRYLWLTSDFKSNLRNADTHSTPIRDYSNSVVECYAALVDALCRHAEPYVTNAPGKAATTYSPRTTRKELLDAIVEILTEDAPSENMITETTLSERIEGRGDDGSSEVLGNDTVVILKTANEDNTTDESKDIVAYAVPTFQAPPSYFRGLHNPIPKDTAIIASLTETAAETAVGGGATSQIRLASAYLNLTNEMIESMARCPNAVFHLLTAGRISHGFKPNPAKVGNKGKAWIPAVFDALGRQGVKRLQDKQRVANSSNMTNLWYYQRNDWTFHAKGVWFTTTPYVLGSGDSSPSYSNDNIRISDPSSLCAVTHGSGNYGARSAVCDMESNLILILPDDMSSSSLSVRTMFQNDWNQMCDHAVSAESEEIQPLSRKLQLLLPVIRPYF